MFSNKCLLPSEPFCWSFLFCFVQIVLYCIVQAPQLTVLPNSALNSSSCLNLPSVGVAGLSGNKTSGGFVFLKQFCYVVQDGLELIHDPLVSVSQVWHHVLLAIFTLEDKGTVVNIDQGFC